MHACLLHARLLHDCDVTHISSIGRFATSISLREHANERYAECLGMNWCSKHLIIINNPTQNDLFTEINNFIEVYNNSVIELIQCFGTSFFGRIDHLASSVIKFRPKNSVTKHCIRSITYNYVTPTYKCHCNVNTKTYILPHWFKIEPPGAVFQQSLFTSALNQDQCNRLKCPWPECPPSLVLMNNLHARGHSDRGDCHPYIYTIL